MQFKIATLDRDHFVTAVRQRIDEGLNASRTRKSLDVPGFLDTRELLKDMNVAASQVGTLPPQPPTLRARIGSVLVRGVQRMLFWYTPLIQRFQRLTVQALTAQNEQIQQLLLEHARLSEEVGQEQRRLLAQLADLQAWQKSFRGVFDSANVLIQSFEPRLQAQERRLSLLSRILEQQPRPFMPSLTEEQKREFDAFYLAFEDHFRGTPESVRERLSVYLPYLEATGAGAPDGPVLDIGCGRGEWLRLLRDSGLSGEGVDANSCMIECCRRQELVVAQSDALLFLRASSSERFGAVTAFHIVEHLPLDVVMEMLKQIRRVLKPGGIAILETPNPANILVGTKNFYHDPTHRNPIPSATFEFLLLSFGFTDVRVLPLNPCEPQNLIAEDGSAVVKRFNELFFGAQDYAVIGRKL